MLRKQLLGGVQCVNAASHVPLSIAQWAINRCRSEQDNSSMIQSNSTYSFEPRPPKVLLCGVSVLAAEKRRLPMDRERDIDDDDRPCSEASSRPDVIARFSCDFFRLKQRACSLAKNVHSYRCLTSSNLSSACDELVIVEDARICKLVREEAGVIRDVLPVSESC